MTTPLSEATVITILSTSGRPTLITGSSIQMPVQIQSSIATVPVDVVSGTLSATIAGTADVTVIGTPTVSVAGIASVSVVGTPSVNATIVGTPTVDATIIGTPTVTQAQASYFYAQTGLATIKATAGTLFSAVLTGEAGILAAAGTAVLLNATGTIAVLAVPAGQTVSAQFGPGVGFGTLIASIIGTVDLTVVYR